MSLAHRSHSSAPSERIAFLRPEFQSGGWGFVAESRDWAMILRSVLAFGVLGIPLMILPSRVEILGIAALWLVAALLIADAVLPHRIRFDEGSQRLRKDRWLFGRTKTALPPGARGRLVGSCLHILASDGTLLEKVHYESFVGGRVAAAWLIQRLTEVEVVKPRSPARPSSRQAANSFGALIFAVVVLMALAVLAAVPAGVSFEWRVGLIVLGVVLLGISLIEVAKGGLATFQNPTSAKGVHPTPPTAARYQRLAELLGKGDVSQPLRFSGQFPKLAPHEHRTYPTVGLWIGLMLLCVLLVAFMFLPCQAGSAAVIVLASTNPAWITHPGSLVMQKSNEVLKSLTSADSQLAVSILPGPTLGGDAASNFKLLELVGTTDGGDAHGLQLLQVTTPGGVRYLDVARIEEPACASSA